MRNAIDNIHLDTLELTLDAVEVEDTARFWADALGYRVLYHRDPYVVLGPMNGGGPRLVIQHVDRRAPGKSSVHLDLRVAAPQREVERLKLLGAQVYQVVEEADKRWTVMADPEGTVFCVCPARDGDNSPADNDDE